MQAIEPALRRAARTFIQAFLGVLIGSAVLGQLSSGVVDVDALKKVGVSAVAAGCVAVVSFVYNALEDSTGTQLIKKT